MISADRIHKPPLSCSFTIVYERGCLNNDVDGNDDSSRSTGRNGGQG